MLQSNSGLTTKVAQRFFAAHHWTESSDLLALYRDVIIKMQVRQCELGGALIRDPIER